MSSISIRHTYHFHLAVTCCYQFPQKCIHQLTDVPPISKRNISEPQLSLWLAKGFCFTNFGKQEVSIASLGDWCTDSQLSSELNSTSTQSEEINLPEPWIPIVTGTKPGTTYGFMNLHTVTQFCGWSFPDDHLKHWWVSLQIQLEHKWWVSCRYSHSTLLDHLLL